MHSTLLSEELVAQDICACTEHGHVKALVTEFFGNYTIQDLLGGAHAFRLAAAQLQAEGSTSQDALDKLVGKRDGSDSLSEILLSPVIGGGTSIYASAVQIAC